MEERWSPKPNVDCSNRSAPECSGCYMQLLHNRGLKAIQNSKHILIVCPTAPVTGPGY